MKISSYHSLFNLENNLFDWKAALENFTSFFDETVIATTTDCKDNTVQILKDYTAKNEKIKVVVTDISLQDLDFDGRIKDAALQACSGEFASLLDFDERVKLSDRPKFDKFCQIINEGKLCDAFFIPVIDLFYSERHIKSIGQKWYLAKNKPNIGRGIVNFAKLNNGKIDHTASDTCELIYRKDSSLVKSYYVVDPRFNDTQKLEFIKERQIPVIYHLGWLQKEKRLLANSIWGSVWSNRAGFEVNTIKTEEELDKIPYWEHGLPLWNE